SGRGIDAWRYSTAGAGHYRFPTFDLVADEPTAHHDEEGRFVIAGRGGLRSAGTDPPSREVTLQLRHDRSAQSDRKLAEDTGTGTEVELEARYVDDPTDSTDGDLKVFVEVEADGRKERSPTLRVELPERPPTEQERTVL